MMGSLLGEGMTVFNEENTVEQMVLDTLGSGLADGMIAEERAGYGGEIKSWHFVPAEGRSHPSGARHRGDGSEP